VSRSARGFHWWSSGFRAEVDPAPEPSPVVGYRLQRSQEVRGVDDGTGRRSVVASVTYTPIPVDAQGRPVDRRLLR
jgi:hypothetical protein